MTRVAANSQCACGKVTIDIQDANTKLGACHCNTCRRWGGGPLMTTDSNGNLAFSGEENIKIFDSSEWAERGFCQHCGSHLFYRLKDQNKYFLPVGLFGQIPNAEFDHQVFVDSKPEFYSFSQNTKCMTGAEVFAAFSSD